jgi:hypothetical protein
MTKPAPSFEKPRTYIFVFASAGGSLASPRSWCAPVIMRFNAIKRSGGEDSKAGKTPVHRTRRRRVSIGETAHVPAP